MRGWQANTQTHLCVASNIRAMPENEKPPAMRVDIYLYDTNFSNGSRFLGLGGLFSFG